ncbi:hypothetical protein AV530_015872 [Patagioenas fasciata monilis]|uniref:Uncharacterized protein n=1 Tax=Patagioenas fasciata monilis TaxID=372326 RepID=A0A1V4KJ44_PATFA|nr:hypothetical protein AV530_015872 [Patagioenas fasciata monilis]
MGEEVSLKALAVSKCQLELCLRSHICLIQPCILRNSSQSPDVLLKLRVSYRHTKNTTKLHFTFQKKPPFLSGTKPKQLYSGCVVFAWPGTPAHTDRGRPRSSRRHGGSGPGGGCSLQEGLLILGNCSMKKKPKDTTPIILILNFLIIYHSFIEVFFLNISRDGW